MRERHRPGLVAYGAAMLATSVSLLVRWPLWPVLGDSSPFLTFAPAVLLAAYLGGLWPGLLATALGALAADFFLIEPYHSLRVTRAADAVALLLFLLIGALISALCESLHRARRRLLDAERRRAEAVTRRSEERFRGTFENAAVGIAHVDGRHRCVDVNQIFCDLVGSPRAEALGKTIEEVVYPDDLSANLAQFDRVLRGDLPSFTMEKRFVRKDGTLVWAHLTVSPQRDAAGDPVYCIVVAKDISERERLEEELRRANDRVELALRGSNIGIWEYDTPDGVCEHGHVAFDNVWQLLGYDQKEWAQLAHGMSVVHPEDLKQVGSAGQAYRSGGANVFEVENRVRHKDGSYRWFLSRAVPIRDESGRVLRWLGTHTDVTAQREAKEAAEAANRDKDEFLANVSHEIRTPMNAILGMTELALETPLTEDQRHYLKTVKSAAESLLGVINDLLDFSKIEAGKLALAPADFSLRAAVGDTLRTLAIRAHRKGLELVSHVHPDVPDALAGDAGRLRQVLLNLVGNAIKFTERGEVLVRVEADGAPAPDGEVCLRFLVRDTGIGIPSGRQESIFRAFEQEDSSTTRRYGGTGLGLTIAARLVALMGGSIAVESAPGRGSTFSFTARFGRRPSPPEPGSVRLPVQLSHLRVLIVDDSATNRHILEGWLRGWQMEPVARGDGRTALDTLRRGAAGGRPFALVLLDSRMPDTDGLTLAAAIRGRPELSATRILLLTSGELPGDPARLRALRVDGHLLKPVQQDELLEAIDQVMNRGQGDAGPATLPAPTPTPAAAPLRVLVAEDNEFSVQLLVEALARQGHHPRLAKDGREALEMARAGGSDLLLLDVHMPELDGFQVVRAIREGERVSGEHLPVIALTARSKGEDRRRCLAAGMDDFLTKPVRLAELAAAIDRAVGARPPTGPAGLSLLDPSVLLATCGGDAGTLERLCETFRARLPGHLTAARRALDGRDAAGLSEAAHKLCGMLAAFSTAASAVASDLEDQAALGRLDEAPALVDRLEAMGRELMRRTVGLCLEALRATKEAPAERPVGTRPGQATDQSERPPPTGHPGRASTPHSGPPGRR